MYRTSPRPSCPFQLSASLISERRANTAGVASGAGSATTNFMAIAEEIPSSAKTSHHLRQTPPRRRDASHARLTGGSSRARSGESNMATEKTPFLFASQALAVIHLVIQIADVSLRSRLLPCAYFYLGAS